ncbi:transcription termination factor MTERF2, chloroplastic-like isoform X1 [Prosopis cineraria]|uniref:transcription termination factor MTERF2, chloroplastic-like isoform X1 n=2 Tax=Prosopis cineraria TaxID=364024 RepID=UPI00240EC11D|nr:transcription termination factor MTERF2, chloroplastic-like isoform X1 [Prosopis cineraria]
MAACCPSCSKFTPSSFLPHSSLVPSFFGVPSSYVRSVNVRCFYKCQRVWLRSSRRFVPLLASSCSNFESVELQEAQNAVSKLLREFGVSEEESNSIASNSPKYVRMLVDEVRDLDELSMWETQIGGFQEKVVHIARKKGDNGKVVYLESLGLSLSSAMNVARYLSGETLVALIHKVKCMKELFFSGSESYEFPVRRVRNMMMQLSIPIDEDLQQTLSFFEKVEARRGGLTMLNSSDAAFDFLIESFPRLLLLSVKSHMKPLVEFLESVGIQRDLMRNILLTFPPSLLWNIEVFKSRILALNEIGGVNNNHVKLLIKYPWILSKSIQDNYKEILSLFDSEKVPKAFVDHAIKSWPHILGCSSSKLKLMVDQFGEIGVQQKKLGQVIAKSPQLLLQKPQDFLQVQLPSSSTIVWKSRSNRLVELVVLFFENMGFDRQTIGKILVRCPEIFAACPAKTLKRKIEFLHSIGVSEVHLPRVIKKYPELLVSDPDRTMLPRLVYLMKLGLSERDIALMVRSFSPLLGYSIEEVLRPKAEFLVNTMERPVKDVVGYPRYFSYSLEKKIKPRFWVLKGRNIECSLKDMLAKNDEEFAAEYMNLPSPHS